MGMKCIGVDIGGTSVKIGLFETTGELLDKWEVKVTPQRGLGFDSIAETIYKYDEVTSVYLMSGGFDFTVIIEGKTMKSVAQFVAAKLAPLDSVLSTSTHFVLKKYKDYGTVIDEEDKDERMLVTP